MKNKRILVITGNGKGKTTAAIGIIIRSLGHEKKVGFFKFFKSKLSGEDKILKKLGVRIFQFKKAQFFNPQKIPKNLIKECEALWQKVLKNKDQFDLIVLDEINLALSAQIITKKDFINFAQNTKANLICTGRAAPIWLKKIADTVSEIKDIKHDLGIGNQTQQGIEF
ncbi:MAG: cob(I)yrinic acid a,c-diamide adenosyltransferase [Patescibacteria group bacterium]|nr:cob(I)yrinic acid a,c-diamide adenosyltransferase [Patescibacteria group bacterium]